MTPRSTLALLALGLASVGCVPWDRLGGDELGHADAPDGAPVEASADAGHVVAVDAPGHDVVVFVDEGVVWLADRPTAETGADGDGGSDDAPEARGPTADAGADGGSGDVGAVVDAPAPCGALEGRCDGVCVPLLLTAAHCGACGHACPRVDHGAATCAGGACGVMCATGYADCTNGAADGCETDVRSDPTNCGACGRRCGGGAVCAAGACVACPAGQSACGGVCVDRLTDAMNCGGCGMNCMGGRVCALGECAYVACRPESGWVVCAGACVNLYADPTNCYQCGRVCEAGMMCRGGDCVR